MLRFGKEFEGNVALPQHPAGNFRIRRNSATPFSIVELSFTRGGTKCITTAHATCVSKPELQVMNQTHEQLCVLQELSCRRRAVRIPNPVEVRFQLEQRTVKAIIRDTSIDETARSGFVGIGVLHQDFLPLDQPIVCQTESQTEAVPELADVTLRWTRHFGRDGYLSGGLMVPRSEDT